MPTLITTGGASARAYGFGAVSATPFLGNYYVNTVSFNAQTGSIQGVFGTIDSSSNPILWSPYVTGGTTYNAITKFDTTGAVVFSKYYDTFSGYGLATYTDSANNIYCVTYNGSSSPIIKLYKLNSSGAVQWGYTYAISTTGISNLGTIGFFAGQSNAATVDSSGNSYIAFYYTVASVYQILILKIDSSGTLVWKNSYSLSATSINTATISVDSSGNVWVEGFSGTNNYLIMQISSSGTVNWAYTFSTGLQSVKAITFDTSGNAWINATGGASGKLFSMNTSGSVLSAYLAPSLYYLNGANGSIYQTDSTSTIAKFSSSGGSASYTNQFSLDILNTENGFVLLDKQNSDAILFFGQSGFQIGMSRLPNNGTGLGTYPNSGNVISTNTYAPSPVATYSVNTNSASFSTTTITLTSVTIVSATFSNTVTRTTSTPGNTNITYTTSSTNVSTLTSGYGSQTYQGGGTYSWIAPTGVTSVSVVAIGGGADSSSATYRAGGLGYINNYSVTPGNSYTVFLGDSTQQTYFVNNSTVAGNGGNFSAPAQYGNFVGTGGGRGGLMSTGAGGGSGAGGYSGAGGNNQTSAPAGGGGGGGGNGSYWGGGGVSVLGQGSPGTGSTSSYGTGGSGGGNGTADVYCPGCSCYPSGYVGGRGGNFGGGASAGVIGTLGAGQAALRIMWPGSSRSFPSTNAGAP